ncbi:MAG: PASTA domain-containing protein, partial [Acidimicrobiia bacterium]
TTRAVTTTTQAATTTTQATSVVPNIVGMTSSQATSLIASLNLGWSLDPGCYDGSPNGTVAWQEPSPGYVMLQGSGPDGIVYVGVNECP